MKKIRWGIISTAKIGREKVIPALQRGEFCQVVAIASPNRERMEEEARRLSIPLTYHSYEELLNDPEIDAVYIPLPNHLHVPWTLKAVEAGKHVLCEKPIGLSSEEARQVLETSSKYPHLLVMEAFMYRFHPQWQKAKDLVDRGRVGELKTVQSFFSYHNIDPANIRNRKELGGGVMMDIGCYCVSFARYLFGREPRRTFGILDYDPVMQTDRLASGILDFGSGTSTFTCSTQLMPYQRVNIVGAEGRIEIEIPVNAPPDKATRIQLHTKEGTEEFWFDPVDQYTLQGDAFSKAVLSGDRSPVTGLQDSVHNMKIIEAVFRSAESGTWQDL